MTRKNKNELVGLSKKVGYKYSSILRHFALRKLKENSFDTVTVCRSTDNEVFEYYKNLLHSDVLSDHKKMLDDKKKETENLKNGFVYFLVNNEYSFCKIGFSDNPEKRLSEVQTGCPYALRLHHFFTGTTRDERNQHHKYKHLNSNGEWFFIKDELKEYLDSVICKNVLIVTSSLKFIEGITEDGLLKNRGAIVETKTNKKAILYFDSIIEKGKYEVCDENDRPFFCYPHNMKIIEYFI